MTRGTFQSGFVALLQSHHPEPPAELTAEVETGVKNMIAAAIRSADPDGLRPEVIYAIRASKLAARLLPAEVYRDPLRRAQIKASIRALIQRELMPHEDGAAAPS